MCNILTPVVMDSGLAALRRPGMTEVLLLDLRVGDLAARVFLPDIHHVIQTRDVALLVVADLADHGLVLAARMQRGRDLLGIGRFRLLGGLLVLTGVAFLAGFFTQMNVWLIETFPVLQSIG